MKLRILTVCLGIFLITPHLQSMQAMQERLVGMWNAPKPAVSSSVSGKVADIVKKMGDQLTKLLATAETKHAAAIARAKEASGVIGTLDSMAKSILGGAASLSLSAIRHPSLLLVGTGLALYMSSTLRGYASRGIRACYHVYARNYPNSMLVHGIQVFDHLNPQAQAQAAAQQQNVANVAAAQAADQERQQREAAVGLLRDQIRTLTTQNDGLQRQVREEQQRRVDFDGLTNHVGNLDGRVHEIGTGLVSVLNGHDGQPGIIAKVEGLGGQFEALQKQTAGFPGLLEGRLQAYRTEIDRLVANRIAQDNEQLMNALRGVLAGKGVVAQTGGRRRSASFSGGLVRPEATNSRAEQSSAMASAAAAVATTSSAVPASAASSAVPASAPATSPKKMHQNFGARLLRYDTQQ